MGVNSLPKTVTRQRRGCDLNPGSSAPESSTLTTQLPSHPTTQYYTTKRVQSFEYACTPEASTSTRTLGPDPTTLEVLGSVVTALKPVRAEQVWRRERKQNWTVPHCGSVLPRSICLSLRPWSYSLYTVEPPRNLTCTELG